LYVGETDGQTIIYVDVTEAPPGTSLRAVDENAPQWSGLSSRLDAAGVSNRRRFPVSARGVMQLALPLFVGALGIFAFALGLPGVMRRRAGRVRLVCLVGGAAVVALWFLWGGLSWPGYLASREPSSMVW
jgi:lipopolysaccharide export LptBFGC system permease protein LptF